MTGQKISNELELIVKLVSEYGILTIQQIKTIFKIIPETAINGMLVYLQKNKFVKITEDKNAIVPYIQVKEYAEGITESLWYVIHEIDLLKEKNNTLLAEGKKFRKTGDFSSISKSNTPTGIIYFDTSKHKAFEVVSLSKDNVSLLEYLEIENTVRADKYGKAEIEFIIVITEECMVDIIAQSEIRFQHKIAVLNLNQEKGLESIQMLELE